MIIRESVKIGDKTVTLETGRIAKQAGGAVLVSCGDTVVLVTVCATDTPRPGVNFMPMSVDYVEKTYAAGRIPGGFFKREARLRDHEILTSRLIDRPCRPLFPEAYYNDVQVICTVMSIDAENPSDILALTGASAALHISPVPWAGPVAGVRVGRVDGRFIANPTYAELEKSDCDLVIAASKDAIVMVEGESKEMSEADLLEALFFGKDAVQDVLRLIDRIREACGKEKQNIVEVKRDARLDQRVREHAQQACLDACQVVEKHARSGKHKEVRSSMVKSLLGEFPEQEANLKAAYEDLQSSAMRSTIIDRGVRVDGRDTRTVRPIHIEVGVLPRVHGSTLFTRGETQAIVTATLGTAMDEQKIDALTGEYWKRFMLHYNFPPFSVGECKPLRGTGRREVGHGNLAERALAGQLPSKEEFPYTLRIVSEITESNGSSSMASVCGGSLALMDAGVPVKAPVAGVAMGLIKEGDRFAILTDILGDEDHIGDMDFKVCGTDKGVTAIQMDIKIAGLTREIMDQALRQAKDARLHVLSKMNEVLAHARPELSAHAPRITTIKVKPDQIRLVIGPGGKMIKAIVDQTGCQINVEDDGTVAIASSDSAAVAKAIAIIEGLTTEPEVGKKYKGIVRRVEAYGAFLEISPGSDGLLHISDMDWTHVNDVTDVMNLGDEVEVMVSNVDRDGRIRLTRKELLPKPEGYVERPPREFGGGDRGGRGGDRGGRGGDRDRGPRRGRDDDRGARGGDRGPRPEREPRAEREPGVDREAREARPEREPRVEREPVAEREPREARPERAPRAEREPRVEREPREARPEREPRVEREPREARPEREPRVEREPREARPEREPRAPRPEREPRAEREPRDVREARDGVRREERPAREPRVDRDRDREVRDDRPRELGRDREGRMRDRDERPRDADRLPREDRGRDRDIRETRDDRGVSRDRADRPRERDPIDSDRPRVAPRDDDRRERSGERAVSDRPPRRDDRPSRDRVETRDRDRAPRRDDDVRPPRDRAPGRDRPSRDDRDRPAPLDARPPRDEARPPREPRGEWDTFESRDRERRDRDDDGRLGRDRDRDRPQ